MLQNPAYYGKAAYGKARMVPRANGIRLRTPRGRPDEPRKAHIPKDTDQKNWVFIPVPPLIEPALYQAAQGQLQENRTSAHVATSRREGAWEPSQCKAASHI